MTPVAVIFEAHRLNRAQRSHARNEPARYKYNEKLL